MPFVSKSVRDVEKPSLHAAIGSFHLHIDLVVEAI
jgi:hypothetical protein